MKKLSLWVVAFVLGISVFGSPVFGQNTAENAGSVAAPTTDSAPETAEANKFVDAQVDDRNNDFDGVIPSEKQNKYFADKFASGNVELSDIPLIIVKFIDLVSKLAGTVAVIFLMVGGIKLMMSGVSDDKESAKNTIQYAIIGIVVTFLAWIIVYVIQAQMTGAVTT